MPQQPKSHVWRAKWRKREASKEPNQNGEMPQVDAAALTPKESREQELANLEAVQASRPLKPPGRA